MDPYNEPISKFRDVIRNAGDDSFGLEIDGEFFEISKTYGETDLIPCMNNCKLIGGFYAVILPSEEYKHFIQIMYQCSYCDTVIIKNFDSNYIEAYSKDELFFLKALLSYVLPMQLEDMNNYGKRQKFDLLKNDLEKELQELKF